MDFALQFEKDVNRRLNELRKTDEYKFSMSAFPFPMGIFKTPQTVVTKAPTLSQEFTSESGDPLMSSFSYIQLIHVMIEVGVMFVRDMSRRLESLTEKQKNVLLRCVDSTLAVLESDLGKASSREECEIKEEGEPDQLAFFQAYALAYEVALQKLFLGVHCGSLSLNNDKKDGRVNHTIKHLKKFVQKSSADLEKWEEDFGMKGVFSPNIAFLAEKDYPPGALEEVQKQIKLISSAAQEMYDAEMRKKS